MLVLEGGLSPEYVLDKMEQYEIAPLVSKLYLKNKESWEQARLIGYITAQTQSTKKLKPTDIMKFPWEEVEVNTKVSNEDRERLIEKAKKFKLNKNG
jgi:hypothetical protein